MCLKQNWNMLEKSAFSQTLSQIKSNHHHLSTLTKSDDAGGVI
ncbi:hypothetical protein [Methanobrevibacter millerae]|nr:hypothetical protein [Methanobrevibacter millerae]